MTLLQLIETLWLFALFMHVQSFNKIFRFPMDIFSKNIKEELDTIQVNGFYGLIGPNVNT